MIIIEFKYENCVKSAIYGILYEYKWVELGSISAVVSQVHSGDIKTNSCLLLWYYKWSYWVPSKYMKRKCFIIDYIIS